MKHATLAFLCSVMILFNAGAQTKTTNYISYVNPYIGSALHGHVFVGANVPFGGVQLGPINIMQTWDKFNGWDWCSGYNYISKEILGFTHLHLSGTGIGDLNDLLVLPATGAVQTSPMKFENENTGYGSFFTHEQEKVSPGYYKVFLPKYGIEAELTATERAGYHKYTFTKNDNPHLLIDLAYAMGWDKATHTEINWINDSTITGYRFSTGWAPKQKFYFAILLNRKINSVNFYRSNEKQDGQNLKSIDDPQGKAAIFFNINHGGVLTLRVGISAVSESNALQNVKTEIGNSSFNEIRHRAEHQWNKALGVVDYEADAVHRETFYTALYHSMFAPVIYNDANGDYLGADLKPHTDKDFTDYTIFSLWDIYRGFSPLMTIIQPQRINDWIKTFLHIYKEQGKLPVWHLNSNETNTMVGYPAVPIVVDAFLKGFRDYDVNLAYEAVKQSAMQQTDGINFVQKLQFIPADSVAESVAKALEYAISDYGIAQMAKALGKTDDYQYFSKRADLYKLYYDKSTGFMRGRISENEWRTPFSPLTALHRQNDYTEGNGWEYTWLVPQDVHGLIKLMGGDKNFTTKLDSFFVIPADLGKGASPDISGMIGQYAQGNEPNHHIAYLYAYVGQQWKTAEKIREITDSFYTNKPGGLCGNDDEGQMSAWNMLSSMGFYPVSPTKGIFVFGSPLMQSATINLADGKKFTIKANNQSKANKYIQKIMLDRKAYTKSYISYDDIMKGGEMEITMGSRPSKFGSAVKDRP